MKFEVGKQYRVGSGTITVEKRTPYYVTVSGMYTGRLMVREWLTGGEIVLVPIGHGVTVFCFSWKTKRYIVYTDENLTGIDCKFRTYDDHEVIIESYGKNAAVTISGKDPGREMEAQLSDGMLENIKVVKVEEA